MKAILTVLVLFLITLPASSQINLTGTEAIERFCHAPEATTGPEFDRMERTRNQSKMTTKDSMSDCEEYFASVFARIGEANSVPFREGKMPGWRPIKSACHLPTQS